MRILEVIFAHDACEDHRLEYFPELYNTISRKKTWECERCKTKKWIVEDCKYSFATR